ncbi:MAG: Cobalt-zinc-cadmium resistance protein CzcD [Propionibacteriaceae bacterium]|nr:Cobalt-zinc-cadmium resistance protein CzcD [Propionibacteriaceae bacterium]
MADPGSEHRHAHDGAAAAGAASAGDDVHVHPAIGDGNGGRGSQAHEREHSHGENADHDHGDHDHPSGIRGWLLNFVRPHSHDAADSIDSALEASGMGIRAVKISLAALMVTAFLQVFLVIITGSVALLADTIHNFSDALTSVPLWIAFVLGRRAASRSHTFGYRRAEDLAGLFIVAMIAFSALLAGWESINRLIDPHPITNLGLVMAAGVIGFAGNELVASYRIRVGKRIGSAALVADGYHARTDGFTSLAVVFGAIGVLLGFPQADPIVGLLITVAILFVLKDAVRQVFGRLMDAVDPVLVELVEHTAGHVPQVEAVSGVRLRWIGHRLDAALHVTVDCDLSVADGHRVGEDVRHALFHEIKGLDHALVHVDPCDHRGDIHHDVTAHHIEGTGAAVPEGPHSH